MVITLSKLDALNPFESNTIFRFSPQDKEKIQNILKRRIQKKVRGKIKSISFKKFGSRILYYIFFSSGEKVKFFEDFKISSSGNLVSTFFEINLSNYQRKVLQNPKNRTFLISKKFSLSLKKWEKMKRKYLSISLLKEFIRIDKLGKKITVGIRYKDKLDPWPKILILGSLPNTLPPYRMVYHNL